MSSPTIEEQLGTCLKEAMRGKDKRTADIVRMLKTRVMERRTAKGFSGEVDDALYQDVIMAYAKSLKKAIEEYRKSGDRGAEMIEQLEFEITFCGRFLPAQMSESEIEALVREVIDRTGAAGPKQVGRVMGEVMKAHKGRVEAPVVKRIAERLLSV